MSNFYKFPSNFLESGKYHGRVLDFISNKDDSESSSSKKRTEILVLVEDQIYTIKIKKKIEVQVGSFISFNLDSNCVVDIKKIELIPFNFDPCGDAIRWRRPSIAPSRMKFLQMRHKLIFGIREWFNKKKFIETETPFLVRAPSPESQISPVRTDIGFLITSPEFQMKRLLVGGFEKIFQVARCFRRNEIGSQHNPEFTMLEWYRTEEKLEVLINDIEKIVMYLIKKNDEEIFDHIPSPPWPRVKVADLFKIHLGITLDGSETAESLTEKVKKTGNGEMLSNISNLSKFTNALLYEQIFCLLWNRIEEKISKSTPLFVCEWPSILPSLAKKLSDDKGFVDRVELFVNGMELANGFGELTDSVEQRDRFNKDMRNRSFLGLDSVPLDEKFLSSLEQGMPKCSGMALGLDRLIMWMCSANHIRDVLCFSDEEI